MNNINKITQFVSTAGKGVLTAIAGLGLYSLVAVTQLPAVYGEDMLPQKTDSTTSSLEDKIQDSEPLRVENNQNSHNRYFGCAVIAGTPEGIGLRGMFLVDDYQGFQVSLAYRLFDAMLLRGEYKIFTTPLSESFTRLYFFGGVLGQISFADAHVQTDNQDRIIDVQGLDMGLSGGLGFEIGKGITFGAEAGLGFMAGTRNGQTVISVYPLLNASIDFYFVDK